ncbi:hypothetical protein I4U23_027826 [Adineta vaga]|nr:hypothetical protein I4U23_027826 [Adineta vaga]
MSNTFNVSSLLNNSYCPAIHQHICWPLTPSNQLANISCAMLSHQGVDTLKYVTRKCLSSGNWSNIDFAPCFHPDVLTLLRKSFTQRPPKEKEVFEKLVQILFYTEVGGISISFISVFISLIIFFTFRSLYCDRTKIHVNLLLAIIIQLFARLTTYAIQMIRKRQSGIDECHLSGGIQSPPNTIILNGFCTIMIILLQYSKTATFMWMLCEGIQLNNILTVGVFKNRFKTYYYHILGWIVPFCITLSWSIVMFIKERRRRCFYNYNHLIYYWIIDGPRYAVMIINIIFLLNILRVLMVKMRQGSEKQLREERNNSHSPEVISRVKHFVHRKRRGSMNTKFVRKAFKAAIFLLPLLGITHVLETFVSADDKPIAVFAIYCCANAVLISLQGFYCSLLYCFLNAEVREALKRRFQTTQLFYRWKKYFGEKDSHQNGSLIKENQSLVEMKPLNSKLPNTNSILKREKQPLTSNNINETD